MVQGSVYKGMHGYGWLGICRDQCIRVTTSFSHGVQLYQNCRFAQAVYQHQQSESWAAGLSEPSPPRQDTTRAPHTATWRAGGLWLRTNGVNTNGAAATVMNFDRLGKNIRPGTFGKIKVIRLTGVP